MDVKDIFKVYLWPDPLSGFFEDATPGEDITAGVINVNTIYGNDMYEGPQQQIDTGEFTIVSRNPNLDPKVNPNLKYNSRIEVGTLTEGLYGAEFKQVFQGYVTNIDVEYLRNDNPIITITGTDIFGVLQRTVVNQTLYNEIIAQQTGPTWDGLNFFDFLNTKEFYNLFTSKYWTDYELDTAIGNTTVAANGFIFYNGDKVVNVSGYPYDYTVALGLMNWAPAKYVPQVGETLLEVINKYCSTNLNSIQVSSGRFIQVYPFAKYNSDYWENLESPALAFPNYDFSSDAIDDAPYESILLNNGYNRVINQLQIENEYITLDGTESVSNKNNFSYISEESTLDYAVSKLNISTIFPESFQGSLRNLATRYAKDIFQLVSVPSNEIQRITIDNTRHDSEKFNRVYYGLNQTIRIKHRINSTQTIDRIYDIAGIVNDISPDKWETTFILKPSIYEFVYTNQGPTPTITMNSLTGDTNFNFTATITDYATDQIQAVLWCLNAPEIAPYDNYQSEYAYYYASTINGERYVDGIVPSGLTTTWNFDDDGILRPTERVTSPENWFGGIGAGRWAVYAYIILKNGFTIIGQAYLTVGVPEVQADFVWVQNVTSNFGAVQFTEISVNNETGEPDSYAWDFGDGTTSSERNPVKIYAPPLGGTSYDVSLTVFAYGEEDEKVYNTKTYPVTLEEPVLTADFTFSQNRQVVTFTNASTNVGVETTDTYLWDFGDGTTSNEKNPVHTFPADDNETLSFNVTLTAKNAFETTDSITKSVEVVALNASGTLAIRYLQLRQGNLYGLLPSERSGTGIAANICKFRARTSFTQANLSYLKPIGNSSTTNASFRSYGNTIFQTDPWSNLTSPYTNGLEPDAVTLSSASNWSIVIDLQTPTNYIKDIIAEFANNLGGGSVSTLGAYDIYATTETGTLSNPNAVTWFKIGSFEPGFVGSAPDGGREPYTKTMESIRPMPMNIPYFDYTFNNLTATFTSYETADSYAWNFGDGTTSTLKNPVKTFSARGTYNVTLSVTNGGVVTRTTTEPVIVKALVNFDVRHVKLVQNLHTGTTPFDTPTILLASTKVGPIALPVGLNKFALTDFQYEDYSLEFYPSIGNSDIYSFNSIDITSGTPLQSGGPYPNRMLSEPQTLFNQQVGIRAKSLDASNRTQWTAIIDLQKAHKGIEDFTINARRDYFGGTGPNNAPPANPGVSYSVYVTNDTSATINPNTVTWTKIGNDITPSNLAAPKNANFQAGQTFSIL